MSKKAKETTELSVSRPVSPSWITPVPKDIEVEGLENMRPSDLLVPRLILLQGLSPRVVEGSNVAGQIINSITEMVWVKKDEEVIFIPIYHFLEWIRWGDRETGEGIQERSLDPEGTLAQMAMRQIKHSTSTGISVFTVTEYHNFVSLFPMIDAQFAVVISCAKTNVKKGRKLLGLARYRGRYPLYAGQYTIKAVIETNRAGQKYYTYEFNNAGWTDREIYRDVQKLYTIIKEAYAQRKLFTHQKEEETLNNETEM